MIKTASELAAACKDVATNYKTLYIMGCIGAPMTGSNKTRYTTNHTYNKKAEQKAKILAASPDTFGFDCVCLIKSLLWGWSGDAAKTYGGAKYASRGVPDIGTEQLIGVCSDVSADFYKLSVGELLWMKGHVGIYIGGGLAVECTPAWKGCVQITAVHNIAKQSGYSGRIWTKHGKLPYVTYEEITVEKGTEEPVPEPGDFGVNMRVLRKGCEGGDVKSLQLLLIGKGYNCGSWGADGEFGSATEAAVKAFQRAAALAEDGVAGEKTMGRLWSEE